MIAIRRTAAALPNSRPAGPTKRQTASKSPREILRNAREGRRHLWNLGRGIGLEPLLGQ